MQPFPVIDLAATGKNILRLRLAKGLTVRDMQGYFRFVEPRAIYKWQSGQSLPTVDNLLALSHLLEVSMEEILVSIPSSITSGSREESRDSIFYCIDSFSFCHTWKNRSSGKMMPHITFISSVSYESPKHNKING